MSQTNLSLENASAVINRQIHIDREVAHCQNIDEIVSSLSERYEMCTLPVIRFFMTSLLCLPAMCVVTTSYAAMAAKNS